MSAPEPRKAKNRAAEAAIQTAIAQARQRRAEATAEYEARTKDLRFTKHFNTALEAIMRDRLATVAERVLAWAKRYSWGEYSLFAISVTGDPKYQVDCCRELGLSKWKVSRAVGYLQARGYLEQQAKLIIVVIEPVLTGPVEGEGDGLPTFAEFVEQWKVAHASDFETLEVARDTVKRIAKVVRSDYFKFRRDATKAAATLYRDAREQPEDQAGSEPLSPFEESTQRGRARAAQQAQGDSVEGGVQSNNHRAAYEYAETFLFDEIARMQGAYPESAFATPAIDPTAPHHQNLVRLILEKIGTDQDDLVGYVIWVAAQFKGNAGGSPRKSRAPGTSKGPKSLGLLVEWSADYARVAGKGR